MSELVKKSKRQFYEELQEVWKKASFGKSAAVTKADADKFWNENKHDLSIIEKKISELNSKLAHRKADIRNFFEKRSVPNPLYTGEKIPPIVLDLTKKSRQSSTSSTAVRIDEDVESDPPEKKSKSEICQKQDECEGKVARLNSRIIALQNAKRSGIASEDQLKQLKQYLKEKVEEEIKLKKLKQGQARSQKLREKRKGQLNDLKNRDPETYEKFVSSVPHYPENSHRPRLEVRQPLLLQTIVDLVSPASATDERRRTETLRTCTTLDELHRELERKGFHLSRSALYFRVLPKRPTSESGSRHVNTVPVRLLRATNDARSSHVDSHFCAATIKYIKDLAEILGEKSVFVLSQDDKARVPLGITAANKETPILMHLEYRVRLPDHDFPTGSRHKLIPSVYAGLSFDSSKKLTYSGPTYISIRSGKHDKSCHMTHAVDFNKLMELPNFESLVKTTSGAVKPIVIIFTDGGPDEAPRHEGTLIHMASHFKSYNLDAIIVATHAPGQSAYNQVERRMAPLSRDLSGLIIPHDFFGSSDEDSEFSRTLELKNFAKAGEILAEVWNGKIIDSYEVLSEFIPPCDLGGPSLVQRPTEAWIYKHVIQCQYMIQIVKCDDRSCCSTPSTNIKKILPGGFLPVPVPFYQSDSGLHVSSRFNEEKGSFGDLNGRIALQQLVPNIDGYPVLPFDYFCPSVKEKLDERICPICHRYFPTKKTMGSHKKTYHKKTMSSEKDILETIESVVQAYASDSDDTDQGTLENQEEEEGNDLEIITDVTEWIQSPFVELIE